MSEIHSDAARHAMEAVPTIPRDEDGPVFGEPWEAQSFAITLGLHDQGLFTWKEWTAALGVEIKRRTGRGRSRHRRNLLSALARRTRTDRSGKGRGRPGYAGPVS